MSEQIKVTVISKAEEKRTELFHDRNKTLLHTLWEGGISLPSLCGGLGKCGRCLVRFCGYAPFPTQTDRAVLHPQQLRDGYRLACTAKPLKDCKVTTAFIEERQLDTQPVCSISFYIHRHKWAFSQWFHRISHEQMPHHRIGPHLSKKGSWIY